MENFVKVYQGDKTLKCETTDWFPPDVKPVHNGLYKVGADELSILNEWDGKCWRRGDGSKALWQRVCWKGWTGRYL